LDLVVSGTRDAITMIEGFAREISEENMVHAIMFGHQAIVTIVDLIEELRQKAGLGAKEKPSKPPVNPLIELFRERFYHELRERKQTTGKHERASKVKELRAKIFDEFLPE